MSSNGAAVEGTEKSYMLVTGANSGLGFSICCRLIDEFLATRPTTQCLTLIVTTRSTQKGNDTVTRLQRHLQKDKTRRYEAGVESKSRITLQSENVELTNLLSVRTLSRKLLRSIPKLDVIVLNAGIGGWTGINWPLAVWQCTFDLINGVTWPLYKLGSIGSLTAPQLPPPKTASSPIPSSEPPLGQVFCANVFGHYMLAHSLMPLLSNGCSSKLETRRSRIIWVSSIEGIDTHFSISDIQALRSRIAYESSKRLTDILALTANLPSTTPWVDTFLSSASSYNAPTDTASPTASTKNERPVIYACHPGICATSVMQIQWILHQLMTLSFYIARILFGSPWHTISSYTAATAPVWLALSPQSTLNAIEESHHGGSSKWGSSTDRWGNESVVRTEVVGWGYSGVVGEKVRSKGRRREARDISSEDREEFEGLGRECWRQMEGLRGEWEGLLRWSDEAEEEAGSGPKKS